MQNNMKDIIGGTFVFHPIDQKKKDQAGERARPRDTLSINLSLNDHPLIEKGQACTISLKNHSDQKIYTWTGCKPERIESGYAWFNLAFRDAEEAGL